MTFEDRLATADTEFDDAATAAFLQIAEESGKSKATLAGEMDISVHSLERYLKLGWSLPGVKRLAAATSQNVVRMLARENLSG